MKKKLYKLSQDEGAIVAVQVSILTFSNLVLIKFSQPVNVIFVEAVNLFRNHKHTMLSKVFDILLSVSQTGHWMIKILLLKMNLQEFKKRPHPLYSDTHCSFMR